jgi:endonuclease/exonuclease/phosphatase family metal-dependent hydrolase
VDLRLVSFNAQHAVSHITAAVDNRQFADTLTRIAPDVLALQEVDRGARRSGEVDQAQIAADAVGAAAWAFAPAIPFDIDDRFHRLLHAARLQREIAAPAPPESDVGTGIALVSRRPVLAWHTLALPSVPMGRRLRTFPRMPGLAALVDEPRIALAAELELGDTRIVVATTHLSVSPRWSEVQLGRVTAWLEGLDLPAILLGDLNLANPAAGWPEGWRPLIRTLTYPTPRPTVQLDHVLAHGIDPRVVSARVHRLAVSDHFALDLVLSFAG